MSAPAVARPTLVDRIPGVLLLFVVGYGGKLLEQHINAFAKAQHWTIPNVEYVLWAIVIGLVVANTVGVAERFKPGVATYDFWLKSGIVLLGARFLLGDVLKLGSVSLALVAVEIALALGIMTLLGKLFGLKPKLTSLLAVGSAVCGVSAIIATRGAIDADDDDASVAIAAILSLGALALVAFPLIGHLLAMTDRAFGLWAGLAVDNTAEATAAGALYSEAAGKFAVLVKSTRNATIGFIVLAYATYWSAKGEASAIDNRVSFLIQKFPRFILGFLAISALATVGAFSKENLTALANLSRWAFLLTFAGVGLQTDVKAMKAQGWRPFMVGALGEIAIAVMTLGLVAGAEQWAGI